MKTVMIQGTSSNTGKSTFVAGLCRLLYRSGYNVAPFKAQNISLNSYITAGGGEIGYSQFIQSVASGISPDCSLNPVLIKISGDFTHFIVNGKVKHRGNFSDYTRLLPEIQRAVRTAFESLRAQYDILVIEGAGSPAEINRTSPDISNMWTAEIAGAPVVLLANMELGGAFASVAGTLDLLEERHKSSIKGYVFNKYTGHTALLERGTGIIEQRYGKPFLGALPFIDSLGLPEEDSGNYLSGRSPAAISGRLIVGIIRYPELSNSSDFTPLEMERDIAVKQLTHPGGIAGCDLLILPGSKNVFMDYRFLRENNFIEPILEFAGRGKTVIGICGGYQMLLEKISDPHAIEGHQGTLTTLGLLKGYTEMGRDKFTANLTARIIPDGIAVKGFEIHNGRSYPADPPFMVNCATHEVIGSKRGNVWGTYLHNLFSNDLFRNEFLNRERAQKGVAGCRTAFNLEPSLDRLSELIRQHIDLRKMLPGIEIL